MAAHLAYLAEACLLRRWADRDGVEHIHVHFGTNPATVALLCRMLGGPSYSLTVHGPNEFDDPAGFALGEKVHHAAFAVAISSFGRSQRPTFAAGFPSATTTSAVKSFSPRISEDPTP